ncbi:unannotated protein [freshwater metagenome]|uniref:Unannotated protein n=1 Tax=freshwater metagenome TaxID=449393 RepID=A0A6J6U926_9ZZZZ
MLASTNPHTNGEPAIAEHIKGCNLLGNHRDRVRGKHNQVDKDAHVLGERRCRCIGYQHLLIMESDALAARD